VRADAVHDSLALFGRPPLEAMAAGLGVRGHAIRDVSAIPNLFVDFAAQGESEFWNILISGQATASVIRATEGIDILRVINGRRDFHPDDVE
jgi:acetolactate synthase I/II/III large subunit